MRFARHMYRLGPTGRHAIYVVLLAPLFAAVYVASYLLRFDGTLDGLRSQQLAATAVWIIAIKLLVFSAFRVRQGWNRFVTFHDMISLAKASSASSLLLVVLSYWIDPAAMVPRSIVIIDWGLTIVVLGGLASCRRMLEEQQVPLFFASTQTPVLIAGADDAGEALLRAIRRNPKLNYRVLGFITTDPAMRGIHIGGVPVLGTLNDAAELTDRHQVREILMTSDGLPGQQVRALMETGRERGFGVKILPSYEQLLSGSLDLRPRQVSIEDLLRRDPVQLDQEELRRWISNRVMLVTGGAGSIGSEICRQLLKFNPRKLVLVDRWENGLFFLQQELARHESSAEIEICIADVTDLRRMSQVFQSHVPDVVFHAAAYKHVPLMEDNPGEGVKNICLASRLLADLAHNQGVGSFVMISTDKAVNPTSVMGACKRVAELYIQSLAKRSSCRFVTVRFGNVLDSAGSVVPIFREQISRGGPITVTHPEMRRFFMTIPEAAQLVLQAGTMGDGGDIFILDMGQPVRIVDLAEDMIRLSGLKLGSDIEIEFTGIRPGEKLYEELRLDGEEHVATSHPKIMVNRDNKQFQFRINEDLGRLAKLADGPAADILEELQRIIPEYQTAIHAQQPLKGRVAA